MTAVVAYFNSGSLGWVAGSLGEVAYLGTWDGDPGQDRPGFLGGDGTLGSPNTGWPRYDRIAVQPANYVGPGQVAWFRFTVEAPPTPGVYRLYLRPLIEGATWMEDFGVFWVVTVLNPDGSAPPPPPPEWVSFLADGNVPVQDQADIRVGMGRASAYLRSLLGKDPDRTVRVHVFADAGPAGGCCFAGGGRAGSIELNVLGNGWANSQGGAPTLSANHQKIAAHEYAHTWQFALGCNGRTAYAWFMEGMAEYVGSQAMIRDGLMTNEAVHQYHVNGLLYENARGLAQPLQALEQTLPPGCCPYSTSYLAVERLVARSGLAALGTYCERVGAGDATTDAFQRYLGLSPSDFYASFAAYRTAPR